MNIRDDRKPATPERVFHNLRSGDVFRFVDGGVVRMKVGERMHMALGTCTVYTIQGAEMSQGVVVIEHELILKGEK